MRLATVLLALLWPLAAYSQGTTTKNVVVTVQGAGTLTPPPQAAAAGFSTLAFNADFSLPFYANALDNSWLCNRAQDNGSHVCQWYDGIWWSANVPLDGIGANTIGQVFDPTIGKNVMELSWKKSYCPAFFATPSQCTAAFNVMETVSFADQGEALTPQLASSFPSNNAYIEWRYRDNLLQLLDGNDTSALVWWPRCGFNSNTCGAIGNSDFNEIDINENYANHCGDGGATGICAQALQACHAWGNGSSCAGSTASATWVYPTIGDPNFQVYHTIGVLIQSDGVNSHECSYIDDVRQGCLPFFNNDPSYRSSLELAGGMTTFGQLVPSTLDEHMFVEFVRVWSCANWNGAEPARQCNNSSVNGPNQLGPTWTTLQATQAPATAPNGAPAILITQDTGPGPSHGIQQLKTFTNATSIFQTNIAPGAARGATEVVLNVTANGGTNFAGAAFNPTTGQLTGTFVDSGASAVFAANSAPIAGTCSPAPNCGFKIYIVVNMPSSPDSVNVIVGPNGAGDGVSSATTWGWLMETGQSPQ